MFEKLQNVEQRYEELNRLLSDPTVIADPVQYRVHAKSQAEIEKVVVTYRQYKDVEKRIAEARQIIREETDDKELRDLARMEMEELEQHKEELEDRLKFLLLPKDPNDEKNIILEIRAGTGGEEAALFAADLVRMYTRYAERKGWKVEVISSHPIGVGGFKEIIIGIQGDKVYSYLKYEMGVHRVQRVPVTESAGRIHTSAVTVAVLPEAEEVEVDIRPEEIRIDVYRSTGHGGQSVNTTDSAVRITHLPTGLVVSCQDEKSQHKNRAKALRVLRARLLTKRQEEQQEQIAKDRRSQIGTGDRSEKIRTYNFPQNRITDHRIGLTLYRLEVVLSGELDEVIESLIAHFKSEEMKKVA